MKTMIDIIGMLGFVLVLSCFVRLMLDRPCKNPGHFPVVFAVIWCFFLTFFNGLIIFYFLVPTQSLLGCFFLSGISCFVLLGMFKMEFMSVFDEIIWSILTVFPRKIVCPFIRFVRLLLKYDAMKNILIFCVALLIAWVVYILLPFQCADAILFVTLIAVGALFLLATIK